MAQYARIKALLSQRGALIEDFDLLIAATAIEHHLTLVTANKNTSRASTASPLHNSNPRCTYLLQKVDKINTL